MVKHTQTIRCQIAEELFGLSVFEHFVGLAFKGLTLNPVYYITKKRPKFHQITFKCLKQSYENFSLWWRFFCKNS